MAEIDLVNCLGKVTYWGLIWGDCSGSTAHERDIIQTGVQFRPHFKRAGPSIAL